MDIFKLNDKLHRISEESEESDFTPVMFRTPECVVYEECHCYIAKQGDKKILIIDLFNKLEAKFKVGDIVTHVGNLHPGVKCTIAEVNEEEQYYTYKEVNGRTYFKNQDELELVDIQPKFKVGDKVKGVSSENPEKEFVINKVNVAVGCYHYFNGKDIVTMFKDQDKLTLVETDNSRPPVEDDNNKANTASFGTPIEDDTNHIFEAKIANKLTEEVILKEEETKYIFDCIKTAVKLGKYSCSITLCECEYININLEHYVIGITKILRDLGYNVIQNGSEIEGFRLLISW